MKRTYKRWGPEAQEFFAQVELVIATSGLTMDAISTGAGMSKGWLRVHRYYGRPWQPYIINTFCKGAGAPEESRRRLHWLSARALGYEVCP